MKINQLNSDLPCNVLHSCSLVLECPRSGSPPTQHNHDRLTGESTINQPKLLPYDQAIAIINAAPPEIRKLVCADAIARFCCREILANIMRMAQLPYDHPEHMAHIHRVHWGVMLTLNGYSKAEVFNQVYGLSSKDQPWGKASNIEGGGE